MAKYAIYINPMHGVVVEAEEHEVVQNVLVLKKAGKTMGQFTQYLGWHLIAEEEKTPGTVLSLVPGKPETPPGAPAA